jgi:cytochrome c biogenesis protein CcmG/thiol:disulfide interchange protein DsbE
MMETASPKRRNWLLFAPLAIFLALALLFLARLFAGDPSKLPSALIGKPAPSLVMPAVKGLLFHDRPIPGLTPDHWRGNRLALVNVFASWCAPCHQEHPFLMDLAKDARLTILGINYKDKPENARRFLGRLGNPYSAIGADADGRFSIEWGVYGVPETFLVDRDGRIAFKHVGPLTPEIMRDKLEPAIRAAGG